MAIDEGKQRLHQRSLIAGGCGFLVGLAARGLPLWLALQLSGNGRLGCHTSYPADCLAPDVVAVVGSFLEIALILAAVTLVLIVVGATLLAGTGVRLSKLRRAGVRAKRGDLIALGGALALLTPAAWTILTVVANQM
jgi:hypothetical protein